MENIIGVHFTINPSDKQTDYLERVFYATRNTFNELLRRFTVKYNISEIDNEKANLRDVTVDKLEEDFCALQVKPEAAYTHLAPKGVISEKIKQLSTQLTAVLEQDSCLSLKTIRFEDRHTVGSCVYPSGTFHYAGGLLTLANMEEPFEIQNGLNSDVVSVRIVRQVAGNYTAVLNVRLQTPATCEEGVA